MFLAELFGKYLKASGKCAFGSNRRPIETPSTFLGHLCSLDLGLTSNYQRVSARTREKGAACPEVCDAGTSLASRERPAA
jgi:hypothetical protein